MVRAMATQLVSPHLLIACARMRFSRRDHGSESLLMSDEAASVDDICGKKKK